MKTCLRGISRCLSYLNGTDRFISAIAHNDIFHAAEGCHDGNIHRNSVYMFRIDFAFFSAEKNQYAVRIPFVPVDAEFGDMERRKQVVLVCNRSRGDYIGTDGCGASYHSRRFRNHPFYHHGNTPFLCILVRDGDITRAYF